MKKQICHPRGATIQESNDRHTSWQTESWERHWLTHFEGYLTGCLQLKEERQSSWVHNCNNNIMKIEQRRSHGCMYKWKLSTKNDISSMREPAIIAKPAKLSSMSERNNVSYCYCLSKHSRSYLRTFLIHTVGEVLSTLVYRLQQSGGLGNSSDILHASGWVPI